MRLTVLHGRITLTLRAVRQGRDMQILLSGGDAHLGAVALAAASAGEGHRPAPGLLTFPGHREDALALKMAARLADGFGCAVCVSAGVHYDNITRDEIARVERLTDLLTERCLAALAPLRRESQEHRLAPGADYF